MPSHEERIPLAGIIGAIAAAMVVLGPVLALFRVVPAMGGFVPFALGGLLSLGVTVAGMVRRRPAPGGASGLEGPMRIAAAVAAGLFVVMTALSARGGAPRINDFTTDPVDPPAYRRVLEQAPNQGRDMSYPATFAAIQATCCADLAPERTALPPALALAAARAAASQMKDWEILASDEATGSLEAVATTRLFGFKDDVVVRLRPDGAGSRIDVRSKSRDGKGDMGANAQRIRNYMAALRLELAKPRPGLQP